MLVWFCPIWFVSSQAGEAIHGRCRGRRHTAPAHATENHDEEYTTTGTVRMYQVVCMYYRTLRVRTLGTS